MKREQWLGLTLSLALPLSAAASEVVISNSFSAGSPAVAADVNQNFSDVVTAVNDNNGRITTNEATLQDHEGRILANEGAVQANNDAITAVHQAVSVFDNGVRVGAFLMTPTLFNNAGPAVLSDLGYTYGIGILDTSTNMLRVTPVVAEPPITYYLTTDCTGDAYYAEYALTPAGLKANSGYVFGGPLNVLYVPKGAVAASVMFNSYFSAGKIGSVCSTASGEVNGYSTFINDPAVTGVPNTLTGEITIGY